MCNCTHEKTITPACILPSKKNSYLIRCSFNIKVALEGEMEALRSSSDSLRTSSDFSITQNDLPTAEAVVSLLLDSGAMVNLVDSCSSSRPPSYTTPLCFAVDIGNVRVVEMLLKAGALVNPSLGRGDGGCPKKLSTATVCPG